MEFPNARDGIHDFNGSQIGKFQGIIKKIDPIGYFFTKAVVGKFRLLDEDNNSKFSA